MNLLQSDNTYQKLIEHMESCGYSPYHIQHVKREIKWLSKNQDAHEISSYEDACRLRSLETESAEMKEQFRSIYSLFRRYQTLSSIPTVMENMSLFHLMVPFEQLALSKSILVELE